MLSASEIQSETLRLMTEPTTHLPPPPVVTSIMPYNYGGGSFLSSESLCTSFAILHQVLIILVSYLESSTILLHKVLNIETKHMKLSLTTYRHVLSHAGQNTQEPLLHTLDCQ